MSNFIHLRVKDSVHELILINMDLVIEIVPANKTDYGCRLIYPIIFEDDYMYVDVMETISEIMEKI